MISISLFHCCEKVSTHMNIWMIGRNSLPEKEDFYSHLNMEDITDADYAHAKRVCKDFEMRHLGDHHDLCFQNNTLLLTDIFKNFQNMFL